MILLFLRAKLSIILDKTKKSFKEFTKEPLSPFTFLPFLPFYLFTFLPLNHFHAFFWFSSIRRSNSKSALILSNILFTMIFITLPLL
ncbi:Uncharacterised protein [Segatella copri]|nr:Uncharacterised protein [Segatella copri]